MRTDLRGLKNTVMNDDIRYLHICGRLMTGKDIDERHIDVIDADNMLYGTLGMSSEDIVKNLSRGNVDNAALFY